jgi:hypothetical protein
MRFFITITLVLTLVPLAQGLVINEIMANTVADESLNEWIELYNEENTELNLSGWIIGDEKDNDSIQGGLYGKEGTILGPFGYAIITDEATRAYNNFNISADALRLYVNDASIGNGLGNEQDTIFIYDNFGNIIDVRSYFKTTPGLSLALINGSLNLSYPTPGYANDPTLTSDCDYSAELILSKSIFGNSSDFSFRVRVLRVSGQKTNFSSRAKIENMNGELFREYKPFTLEEISNRRTSIEYTPNLEEGRSYEIGANITTFCNDTNAKNDFDNRIVTIKGKPLKQDSFLQIQNVLDLGSDKKAKFGQIVRVRLSAYKGNTKKESIAIWIEDEDGERVSKQSRFGLESRFTNYSLTIPVQIFSNCDKEFDEGSYFVKGEGLGTEHEFEMDISGFTSSICEGVKSPTKNSAIKKLEVYLKEFNDTFEAGKEVDTKIILDNGGEKSIPVSLWSYVYRGSKSYSGIREGNMIKLIVEPHSIHEAKLKNIVEDADGGNYKYKVVVKKDNQKTNTELIREIVIVDNEAFERGVYETTENTQNGKNKVISTANTALMPNYGLVYESSTEKARSLVPVFLIALSIFLNILLIIRK